MNDISISVHYDSDDSVELEVDLHGKPMLYGIWDVEIRYGDSVLRPVGSWTETCVHDDNGCEYLEIDLPLSRDYRLQRFFLLDNADRLLILADTVLYEGPKRSRRSELHYESRLFCNPEFDANHRGPSGEWTFGSGKRNRTTPAFRVFPLALSHREGPEACFYSEDALLTLRQRAGGRSMFAPLFFDLDPQRLKKTFAWRALSVGENMEKVPNDQAVGYRIQLGKEQYLLYHSMTPPANRTVLGHNLIDDLCFARFDPETGVEGLVEVQQEIE